MIAKLERTIRSLDQENRKLRLGKGVAPPAASGANSAQTAASKPLSAESYLQLEEQVSSLKRELKELKEKKQPVTSLIGWLQLGVICVCCRLLMLQSIS